MRRGLILAIALVAIFALVPMAPASAHVTSVNVTWVQIQNGRVVDIFGTIVCSPDEDFVLRVNYDDGNSKAVGRASGHCTLNGDARMGGTGGGQQGVSWVTGRIDSPTGMACTLAGVSRGQARTLPHNVPKTFSDANFGCGTAAGPP
jgi:hypothetical protein